MHLHALNQLAQPDFIHLLGSIFEHSPWVAAASYPQRPFHSIENLHQTMCQVVATADEAQQLELIRAHPDLAGKAAIAGKLTEASSKEQAGAGLNSLTDEEFERFHKLNDQYKDKFKFPFILAVKGHTKHSILAAFATRLPNSVPQEQQTALAEIYKIARFRLEELLQ